MIEKNGLKGSAIETGGAGGEPPAKIFYGNDADADQVWVAENGGNNDAAGCRLVNRNANDPTNRGLPSGFRLALSPSVLLPEARGEQSTVPADR